MTSSELGNPNGGSNVRAVLGYAFFRAESALTIAITILAAYFIPRPFVWWRWWFWIALGVVFDALIVFTSVRDERTRRRVMDALLRERYDPREIKTRAYRQKVEQALVYREQIERVLASTPAGALRDHLYASMSGIADWMGHIFAIAQRLNAYAQDRLIQRDLVEVPKSVEELRRALTRVNDRGVEEQLRSTLKAKEAQLSNLRALASNMEQAELKLEETVGALGTVYSQFQRVRAEKMSRNRARQLSGEIEDQVQRLQDILESMEQIPSV